jgi:hypothetical protein
VFEITDGSPSGKFGVHLDINRDELCGENRWVDDGAYSKRVVD